MATMKKNVAGVFYISLWNTNGTAYQVNPTLAIGDVKVDLDGVSLGNITTLPIVTPAGSNTIKVDYSAAEVNGNDVVFKFVDVAGAEWQNVNVSFCVSVENLDGLGARIPSALVGGRMDSNMGTKTVNIPLSDQEKIDVLEQSNAALDTAISELSQAQPSSTPTTRTALMLLYMALRNRLDTNTSGIDELAIYNNAGTKIAKKLLTDDGADYSEAKIISGP